VVIGEGGSGGALAIGIGNRVLMQEYSTYSVISPESCASILWSDSTLAEQASEKLKMNPIHLKEFGVIDEIIQEPVGGAHRNWEQSFCLMEKALVKNMALLKKNSEKKPESFFKSDRVEKFREMGHFAIGTAKKKK